MIEDELLIAYADGECSVSDQLKVEQALRDDPELRARLEQHRRLAARATSAGTTGVPACRTHSPRPARRSAASATRR